MGVVWAAINELTSREVALKLILQSSPNLRVRLMREAQACGKLAHRNIIEVFDVGETDTGDPFLIMPLLSGENLAQRLARQRRLEPVTAARIARDVARALEAAHAASIIHRDLKPANIFLHQEAGTSGEVVKVLDFGVSKDLASNEALTTVVGGFVGSPAYMSPEQFAGQRDINPRTDLWSLGAVLFEMLTGTRAFQGDAARVMQQVLSGEIPRLSNVLRRADSTLDVIVARCLERNRDLRMPSATHLARELDEFLGESSNARPESLGHGSHVNMEAAPGVWSQAAVPPGNPFPLSPSAAGPLAMDDGDDLATMPINPSLLAGLSRGPAHPAAPPSQAAPEPAPHVPTLASPTTVVDQKMTSTARLEPGHIAAWHGGRGQVEVRGGSSAPSPSADAHAPVGFAGTMKMVPEVPSRAPTGGNMPVVEAPLPPPAQAPASHSRPGDPSMTTGAAAVVQVPSASGSGAARLAAASSSAPLADDRNAGKRLMIMVGAASAVVVTGVLLLVMPSGGDASAGSSVEGGAVETAVPSVPAPPAPRAPEPIKEAAAEPVAAAVSATAEPAAAPADTQAAVVTPPVAAPATAAPKSDSSPISRDVPRDPPKTAAPKPTAPKPATTTPKPAPAPAPKCGKLMPCAPKPKTNNRMGF